MPHKMVTPVIDLGVRSLCQKPYPNHPKGCPNFGKRSMCPPKCPNITSILDFAKPIYVIWNVFDFGGHCKRMESLHPNWSKRQIECCLYWQGAARKHLRAEIKRFGWAHANMKMVTCPEAAGVNVTATMASIDIDLEWPPVTVAYQVALAGIKKN